MKPAIYTIIALLTLSCMNLNNSEYYVRLTGSVEIIHTEIPDTVDNLGFAQIKAKAQATNSCWNNLSFLLTKTSEFEYSLEAFGVFESYGSCFDVMVYGDTTIIVQPEQTGLYRFSVYKGPGEVEIDTMIVK